MDSIITALAAGFIGGTLGVVGTIFSSYYGPRKIEEWREKRKAERWENPRKELLKKLLGDPKHEMRSIETLCRVSGTQPEECRTLLIEIGARGIRIKGNREGWALISRKPLSDIPDDLEE